jgi:hypothetical protein
MPPSSQASSSTWLTFALLTVACWGTYGIFLQMGSENMHDPTNGRIKAFLFVGLAYFLVAVLAPIVTLALSGANWNFPIKGMSFSLVAGIIGAVGALGVLLAFNAAPNPRQSVPVIMTIIFSGAPVLNAIVALSLNPPAKGWGSIPWQFWLGMVLAVTGGGLVTKFKPGAPPHKAAAAPAAQVAEQKPA